MLDKHLTGKVLAKGAVGAVPFLGPLLSEIIENLLPNHRLARIELFLSQLEQRVEGVEAIAPNRVQSLALFEDGARESARTPEEDKIEYFANVVAAGIIQGEEESLRLKKIVRLLASLDVDQITMLMYYSRKYQHDHAFFDRNSSILTPPRRSTRVPETIDADAFLLRRNELVRLDLLKPRIKRFKRGEVPEFDQNTGLPASAGYELTRIGLLLLRQIGVLENTEF